MVATFPFLQCPPPPPFSLYNRDTSITLLPVRVKGQSHFSALSVPFSPRTDHLPEVKASCHLNSHQFTRGEGAVSVGNPTYYLSFPPASPTHRVDWQVFALRELYKKTRWLQTCLEHFCFCNSISQKAFIHIATLRSSWSDFRQPECNVTTNYYTC